MTPDEKQQKSCARCGAVDEYTAREDHCENCADVYGNPHGLGGGYCDLCEEQGREPEPDEADILIGAPARRRRAMVPHLKSEPIAVLWPTYRVAFTVGGKAGSILVTAPCALDAQEIAARLFGPKEQPAFGSVIREA